MLVAGIDIGGTNQTVGVADLAGHLLAVRRGRRTPGGTARDLVASIFTLLDEALIEARAARGDAPALQRIGIGFGGPVDHVRGTVVTSHHVADWSGYPLRERFRERFGVPVVVENDANAAALGEARFGAGRGHQSVLYVNIGTGIGAGIVLDGRILRGAHGLAGEIGHVTVRDPGPACGCGKRGCLEAYASGTSIGRRAREALAAAEGPGEHGSALLRLAGGDPQQVRGQHVALAAAEGDPLAQRLLAETGEYLALAIGNAVNLLDPEVVILGGGVPEAGDVLLRPLREGLRRHVMPGMPVPPVARAQLGYDAGVVGAVAVALTA